MGKPKQPKAPDPYQTAFLDYSFNNPSQYTPWGDLVTTSPTFQNTGTRKNPKYRQTGAGSVKLNLAPELQEILDKQLQVSGITLDEALRRQGELSNLGDLPTFAREQYEQALFDRGKGLLDPVFAEQERSMRDRLANQGLPTTSEAYGYDQDQFLDDRSSSFQKLAIESILGGGDLMGQDISNTAAARSIPFNEIASLLGIQQVQPPQLSSFYSPRGTDFTGAQAISTQANQQNYQNSSGMFNNTLNGLFGLGSAAIGSSVLM